MFKMSFKTGNAAFEDMEFEVTRILQDVKHEVRSGYTEGTIMDYNGNKVGEWSLR